ncbi:hypothetical protein IAU59_003294 [Kwoniella sp. CBS 9459]
MLTPNVASRQQVGADSRAAFANISHRPHGVNAPLLASTQSYGPLRHPPDRRLKIEANRARRNHRGYNQQDQPQFRVENGVPEPSRENPVQEREEDSLVAAGVVSPPPTYTRDEVEPPRQQLVRSSTL